MTGVQTCALPISFSQDYLELYEIKDEFHKELGYELEWMDPSKRKKTMDAAFTYKECNFSDDNQCQILNRNIISRLVEMAKAFKTVMG